MHAMLFFSKPSAPILGSWTKKCTAAGEMDSILPGVALDCWHCITNKKSHHWRYNHECNICTVAIDHCLVMFKFDRNIIGSLLG